MQAALQRVRDWDQVDVRRFQEEIRPLRQPAVLRGVVADWPAVERARVSPESIASYLQSFDVGRPTALMWAPPAARGQFFYRSDMNGLNFERRKTTITAAIDELLAQINRPDA